MMGSVNGGKSDRDRIINWIETHQYQPSSVGRIVLAAPGSGKSTYIETHPDWIDADEIMKDLEIHQKEWHFKVHQEEEVEKHYKRCDEMLKIMKEEGLQVLGSLFWEFEADAIVQIDLHLHQTFVAQRSDLSWNMVEKVRNYLFILAKNKGIVIEDTIEAACNPGVRIPNKFLSHEGSKE